MSQYYQQYPQYQMPGVQLPAPGQPGTEPGTPPDVQTGPQPKAPTPLDPPVVYYNKKWRVPPLVVDTQEEADALDPNEWMTTPPAAGPAAAKEQYPKLYYNINVSPKIVGDAAEEKALGEDWAEFSLPDALCKAAEANNAAKAQALAAKAQASTPPA